MGAQELFKEIKNSLNRYTSDFSDLAIRENENYVELGLGGHGRVFGKIIDRVVSTA